METLTLYQRSRQQGSILLVSLLILIGLTLVSLSSSKSSVMQQKITSHAKDSMLALQVAEAALYEAQKLAPQSNYAIAGTSGGFYDGDCTVDDAGCFVNHLHDPFTSSFWSKSTTASQAIACGNGKSQCQRFGQFVIIRLGQLPITSGPARDVITTTNRYQDPDDGGNGVAYSYKIIAKGTGINPDIERVLVAYFASDE